MSRAPQVDRSSATTVQKKEGSDESASDGAPMPVHTGPGVGTSSLGALMSGGNIGMGQLQLKGDGDGVHAAAAHGISGSGGALPHGGAIQQAFGSHDIGNVQAHVGGKAAEGSKAMGAEAYATGNSIAFGSQPDLHTAAHEAAHVVQQRSGLSLSGGVGKSGDSHEQHADAVADAVVSGKSAEGLLGQYGGGGGGSGVQMKTSGNLVQMDETPDASADEGVKITTATTTAFDFGLQIPIYGPVKLDGKVGGSYTAKETGTGSSTEVEAMAYIGIVVDLYIVQIKAGFEGKVKFAVEGQTDILSAVKKGMNEIVQWKIAKDFAPNLIAAKQSLEAAQGTALTGFGLKQAEMLRLIEAGGDWKELSGKWWFSSSPREWAEWYAYKANQAIVGAFYTLGGEIQTENLVDLSALTAKFEAISSAANKEAAISLAEDAHAHGSASILDAFTRSKAAIDEVKVADNDPSVGFEASIAFKAGASVQATGGVGGEVEVAFVETIKDELGNGGAYDTSSESSTVVSGKVSAAGWTVGLVGDWKTNEVEVALSLEKENSTASDEAAKHSVGSILSAVKGGGSAFQMLSSPLATTRAIAAEAGAMARESAAELVDPKNIAEARGGSSVVGQSIGVEVKLKFERTPFKLVGGSVKVTVIAAKVTAKKALGAAASVGVEGSLSHGASFEAAWG